MEAITTNYRHEHKYLVSNKQIELIKRRLTNLLDVDKNQGPEGYIIRSLYLDDINDSILFDGTNGINDRAKYRFRFYNYDSSLIKFEKKISVNYLKRKTSINVSKEEVNEFIKNRNLLNDKKLFNEIKSFGLLPKIVIEYDRYAFVKDIGNIRITFDTNIKYSSDIYKFLDKDQLFIPVLSENFNILEVKYDGILPGYIAKAINIENLERFSFSKYTTCCNIMNENGYVEDIYNEF